MRSHFQRGLQSDSKSTFYRFGLPEVNCTIDTDASDSVTGTSRAQTQPPT